jgi:hypothetical protein
VKKRKKILEKGVLKNLIKSYELGDRKYKRQKRKSVSQSERSERKKAGNTTGKRKNVAIRKADRDRMKGKVRYGYKKQER